MTANLMKLEDFTRKDWPELVRLDAFNLPRLDPVELPAWAGAYARAVAEDTETPPELAAAMVMVTCATVAARRLRVQVAQGYSEPCNLWMVAALPSGTRKSAVQAAAMAPLKAWEREQTERLLPEIRRIASERRVLETRLKEMRNRAARERNDGKAGELAQKVADLETRLPAVPVPPRLWTSDATPERLGTLLAEQGECMAWLSTEGGIFDMLQGRYTNGILNLDLILKAHSGDAERVDRGGRAPVILDNPCLTIGLCPQPEVLRGLATRPGFRGRGLLARFLYLLPPSPLGFRSFASTPVPEAVRAAYETGLRAMLNWAPAVDEHGKVQRHVVRLGNEACEAWRAFACSIEERMRPGNDLQHCSDWAGKAPGAVVRLAGILHGIEHAHARPWMVEISAETMRTAIRIMKVIIPHSVAALDAMGADPSMAAARRVWAWIEHRRLERFTVREAFNALRGTFPRVAGLREALLVLEERGYLQVIEPPRDGRGRPPSPSVQVRPDMVKEWK